MTRLIKFHVLDGLTLKDWSRYKRRRLLGRYSHNITIRSKSNNLFLNTWLPYFLPRQYKLSAGLIADFAGKKKKKKTYMAGLELGYTMGVKLQQFNILGLKYTFKGHGAQKRGVISGFRRQNFQGIVLVDKTPIAHNGTRAVRARRL